jgi:hypothetical protein
MTNCWVETRETPGFIIYNTKLPATTSVDTVSASLHKLSATMAIVLKAKLCAREWNEKAMRSFT